MSEVVEFYRQQATNNQTAIDWLARKQQSAIQKLVQGGFPSRRDEDWKYTSTDQWAGHRFSDKPTACEQPMAHSPCPLNTDMVIDVINGEIDVNQLDSFNLPEGVVCLPLRHAAEQYPELVQTYLATILAEEHGFHYLNTAYLKSGLFLYLPEQVQISSPIILRHTNSRLGQNIQLRHVIALSKASQASVVEYYQGAHQVDYFTNSITEVHLAESSILYHYKIQCESKAAYHVGHIAVRQMTNSQYQNHSLSLGGALVRSDLTINLDESQAQCLMNGIYAPGMSQHVDHHTTVFHHVSDCQSRQDYKGILQGDGHGVFNGRVVVSPGAVKTDAQQQNKNLLLSPRAEIDTKPQLEIFADDVVCSHGATVGQLEEDALFYLETRGINRAEASRYLIHAFASENLASVPHSELKDWMTELLNQHLG
ncbi:Fe-S cluster assembly protein SufD [Legionella sp. W05-934-2]|jgi:Fe-S cluster assembly protein SufD|uniref:Fe-S cluster assembly protein SufD n=1 Tax=Legionella sp. W05-934-2 TaxID=1198649 RepID=UPI0034633477